MSFLCLFHLALIGSMKIHSKVVKMLSKLFMFGNVILHFVQTCKTIYFPFSSFYLLFLLNQSQVIIVLICWIWNLGEIEGDEKSIDVSAALFCFEQQNEVLPLHVHEIMNFASTRWRVSFALDLAIGLMLRFFDQFIMFTWQLLPCRIAFNNAWVKQLEICSETICFI